MGSRSVALLLLCACGHASGESTDPVVAGGRRVQPASVVSYLGATKDTGAIGQVWISDEAGYCAQVGTMDPCHANFAAGEGPLSGVYLHLSIRGATAGTYSVPTAGSAQLQAVTGAFSVIRISATSGSITFSALDSEGASGSYQLTFDDGSSASGRFQAS